MFNAILEKTVFNFATLARRKQIIFIFLCTAQHSTATLTTNTAKGCWKFSHVKKEREKQETRVLEM